MRKVPLATSDESAEPPLVKFYIYETRARFYVVGRDETKTRWRILKIDRSEPSDILITEDPVCYDKQSCMHLLQQLAGGNKGSGGLHLVARAHGIVGFIKFREPYYMMLVKKKVLVGSICGHAVYKVGDSQLLTVPHPSVHSDLASSKLEQRYKKLMAGVDLTKDFFFSYTYPLMHSLQFNMTAGTFLKGMPYDHMFVWNAYLTRPMRMHRSSSSVASGPGNGRFSSQQCGLRWTVPLIHGFFDQAHFSVHGRILSLTVIARRSRHFAGTRYLKRGVNDKGRVANDVETEQIIVDEATVCADPQKLVASSHVQVRGSIPLFWSQEATSLSPKPDIVLHRYDPLYAATRLHFDNLAERYGEPIVILNLIKTAEKHPREMILRREYKTAVQYLNKTAEAIGRHPLDYIHWDFHKFVKSSGAAAAAPNVSSVGVLAPLTEIIKKCLDDTGYFYSGKMRKSERLTPLRTAPSGSNPAASTLSNGLQGAAAAAAAAAAAKERALLKGDQRAAKFEHGVIRTNCIDCLDRTNVAQYVIGQEALARQLHSIGAIDEARLADSVENDVAQALMAMYVAMGDALALQYGGSAAHNMIMPGERKGQWQAAMRSQELFKSIQRYYSNAITDSEKQDALNLFLGQFRPQDNRQALWELDSDYHLHIGGANSPTDSPTTLSSRSSMAFGDLEKEEKGDHRDPYKGGLQSPLDTGKGPCGFSFAPLGLADVDKKSGELASFDKLIPRLGLNELKPVKLYRDGPGTGGGGGTGASPGQGPAGSNALLQRAVIRQTTSTDRATVDSYGSVYRDGLRESGLKGQAPAERDEEAELREKYSTWMHPFVRVPEECLMEMDERLMVYPSGGNERFYEDYLSSAIALSENSYTDDMIDGYVDGHLEPNMDPWQGYETSLENEDETWKDMGRYLSEAEHMSLQLGSDAPQSAPCTLCKGNVDHWVQHSLHETAIDEALAYS